MNIYKDLQLIKQWWEARYLFTKIRNKAKMSPLNTFSHDTGSPSQWNKTRKKMFGLRRKKYKSFHYLYGHLENLTKTITIFKGEISCQRLKKMNPCHSAEVCVYIPDTLVSVSSRMHWYVCSPTWYTQELSSFSTMIRM